jgi:hypothetical protein
VVLENIKLEDFELSFGKNRYQLQKELRDKKNEQEKTGIGDGVEEKTAEEIEKQEKDKNRNQTSVQSHGQEL